MTLTDLLALLPTMTDSDAKQLALVFGADAYAALMDAQRHRQSQHRTAPVQLTDGRWMLCADLLTEIRPGGIYAAGFNLLPPETFALVGVMPFADAVALLPVAEEPSAP